MGSQQQFCLRWNNHQSNMLTVFDNLFQNEALVDVTLACEGLSLKAHKMVLSACSPYFQTLFIDNPCKHPIVILKDVRFSDLKALVDFMYKGEVNVSQEQLNRLLKTAETLKIRGLAEVTSGYCVDDTSTGNGGGGGSGGAGNSPGLGSSGVTGCSGATGSNGSGCSNLANSSHSAYDSRTLRGSPPPHPSSPPRKRKKVKHKAPRSIVGLGSSSTAATAAAASSTTAERAASHSEVEDSDGPDLIEPKVEITEDNFGPDKMHEHHGSSSTSRHNQQSPDQTNDEAEDMTLVQNMGAGPSGSRVMSNQKGSPSGHHSSLGPLITSTPTTPSDTSSPLLQSSNQGNDVTLTESYLRSDTPIDIEFEISTSELSGNVFEQIDLGNGVIVDKEKLAMLIETAGSSPTRFVRGLLLLVFSMAELVGRSITGRQSSAYKGIKLAKDPLDSRKLEVVVEYTRRMFPGIPPVHVRQAIATKLKEINNPKK